MKMRKKSDLDSKLTKLREHADKISFEKLNKRIYDLDLPEKYLKTLSQNKLSMIHVKLHNALSYKHPFAKIKDIKKIHDRLTKFLKNHIKNDELDD